MYKKYLKRLIDVVLSVSLLVVLSPIIFFSFLLLWLFKSGQVFFTQQRPGLNQKIFTLYKFKTMNEKKDEIGDLLPDEARLTRVGKWIRKLSLDELPQLINVLKGDMSLIGPRPWLVEYLPLYNDFQRRRHEVRPGITGWAQVNGRNQVDWCKRFEMDVWYVDNISFWIDLKILIMTAIKIIKQEGIKSQSSVTMENFKGN